MKKQNKKSLAIFVATGGKYPRIKLVGGEKKYIDEEFDYFIENENCGNEWFFSTMVYSYKNKKTFYVFIEEIIDESWPDPNEEKVIDFKVLYVTTSPVQYRKKMRQYKNNPAVFVERL